jgi:hypothetical protein
MVLVDRCCNDLAKEKTIGDFQGSRKNESGAHRTPRNANGCIGEGPTERDRVSGEISYFHYTACRP